MLNHLTALTLRFPDAQCVPPDPQSKAPAEHITKQQAMIVGIAMPDQATPVKARAARARLRRQRWGVDAVHKVLTRTTYIGRHRFNTKFWKTRERNAEAEIVEMAVPAIVEKDEFEVVQMRSRAAVRRWSPQGSSVARRSLPTSASALLVVER